MCNTNNEATQNDTYLIEQEERITKVTYRKNLLRELQHRLPEAFSGFSERDVEQGAQFRAMITLAEAHGYTVYQLTRL